MVGLSCHRSVTRNVRGERMQMSVDDFDRLLQRMERSSIVTVSQLVGCSVEEIEALEDRYGYRLPRSYVRYLRAMGHRSGRLFTSDHMAVSYSDVLEMTADLRRKWAACRSDDDGGPALDISVAAGCPPDRKPTGRTVRVHSLQRLDDSPCGTSTTGNGKFGSHILRYWDGWNVGVARQSGRSRMGTSTSSRRHYALTTFAEPSVVRWDN